MFSLFFVFAVLKNFFREKTFFIKIFFREKHFFGFGEKYFSLFVTLFFAVFAATAAKAPGLLPGDGAVLGSSKE